MFRRCLLSLPFLLLTLLAPTALLADPPPAPEAAPETTATETGSLSGRLLTADGQAVTDAEIDLVDLRLHAHVDEDGRFRFPDLPPGRYLLRIESLAGGELTQRVTVASGETTELELTLAVIRHDDEVVVTGAGIARSQLELAQPTTVLSGEELRFRQRATLGETLSQEAGIASTSFGQGASRPVIRGIGGDRVRMLQDGVDAGDASSTSPDHAVAIDTAQAERIEVLHGPATLLYGSSAIGGVVNVVGGSIPYRRAEKPVSGFVDLSGGSVSDERSASLALDGGSIGSDGEGGDWAWHIDASFREADDYEIPGFAEAGEHDEDEHEGEEHEEEEEAFGFVPNTDLENRSGTFGFTRFFGDAGLVGFSVSGFESEYGVPGGHGHGDEHDEGEHGEDEHDDDHGEEHGEEHDEDEHEEDEHGEGGVRIDMQRVRYDLRAELTRPFGPFAGAKLRLGVVDYEHDELEGEEREVGTSFFNDAVDGRLELVQQRRGRVSGSVGLQFGRKELEAIGEEAFVPENETETWALFAFQELEAVDGVLSFQVGARFENQENTNGVGLRERSFDGFSTSAGLVWRPMDGWSVALSVANSTKLPNGEELYSFGPHFATNAFEVGNPDLEEETSLGIDLALRKTSGRFTGELTYFHNRFDDFIFQNFTGEEEDGLPVLLYSQGDADFEGFELEARFGLWEQGGQHLDLSFTGDRVRAKFDEGGYLPRIPADRLGIGLHYHRPKWHGYLEVWEVSEQDRVADRETPTEGYTLVNVGLTYRWILGEQLVDFVIEGRNLGDEEVRNPVSFLKDIAPQPGRDINLGLRWFF